MYRSNIAYGVGVASRFITNLGKVHWPFVKWIIRYLRLCFGSGKLVLRVIQMHIGLTTKIPKNQRLITSAGVMFPRN